MAMPVIQRRKDRRRAVSRRREHLRHRSHDAGPQGAAGRHVALPRPEFFQGPGDQVSRRAEGREEFAWTTSWGVSTRLIGGLIMTHGDDDGLVLPPRLAPEHVVILPIYRNDEEKATVLNFCTAAGKGVESPAVRRRAGARADRRPRRARRRKSWQHVKRGVPIRLEVGPRDVAGDSVFMARRDKPAGEKAGAPRGSSSPISPRRWRKCKTICSNEHWHTAKRNTRKIDKLDEFKAWFTPKNADKPEIHGGFAMCHVSETPEVEKILGDLKVTHPLPAGRRRDGRLRRAGQMHFHGPASSATRGVGEGVLKSFNCNSHGISDPAFAGAAHRRGDQQASGSIGMVAGKARIALRTDRTCQPRVRFHRDRLLPRHDRRRPQEAILRLPAVDRSGAVGRY